MGINIGERIKEYRRSKNLTMGQLSKIIGISQGSISDLENSKSKPSSDTFESFLRHTDINLRWLITGEGEMLKYSGNYLTKSNLSKTVNFIQVGAGNPVVKFNMKETVDNIPVPKELLDKRVIPARVSGDSMYPKLKEGTIVLIDTREKEIISGEIYCLNMPDEGLIVKRLFKVPNKVIVRSDNRKYPEFELTYDELNSYNLPIVVGRIRFIAEFRK